MFSCLLVTGIMIAANAPAPAEESWTKTPVAIHLKDRGYLKAGADSDFSVFVQAPHPSQVWRFKKTGKGYQIQLKQTGSPEDGCYLAFDPDGKKPGVFLTKETGPGTYWKLTLRKDEKDKPNDFHASLQATAGKVEGWYLNAG